MKRILLCSLAVPWPSKPLLGVFHTFQARALARLGTEMQLFAPGPSVPAWMGCIHRRTRAHRERPLEYEMYGVQVHAPRVRFAFPRAVRFGLAARLPRLVAAWARRAIEPALEDVVRRFEPEALLAHGSMPWGSLVPEVARRHGIPSAIIEHSADDILRLRARGALARFYRGCARRVSRVFTVGPQLVEYARDVVGMVDVELLPNGAATAVRGGADVVRPASWRGRFVIVAAANYYRRKGLEELVEAFARLANQVPHADLHLITRAPPSLRERAARLAPGRVEFHEPMPTHVLHQWMARADLFALPSWSEAFGLVYAEALANGTPVLMTSDNGFAHYVRSSGCDPGDFGWEVQPRDVPAIEHALRASSASPALGVRMAHRGRAFVERHCSWENNARILLEGLGGCCN